MSDHDKSNPLQDVKNGVENLLTFCEKFNYIDLKQHLLKEQQLPDNVKKIKIHKACQQNVYNQNKKRSAAKKSLTDDKNQYKILRSLMQMFDWKANGMFRGKTCQKNVKHPDRNNCHEVTTLSFKDQILNVCEKQNDQVSKEVALRVASCNDLVAVEARYHTSCRITFVNPEKTFYHGENRSKRVSGRPTENEKQSHFEQLCEWMEQEGECYTVKE